MNTLIRFLNMDLSTLSTDELRTLENQIHTELKVRASNFPLEIKFHGNNCFIVRGDSINKFQDMIIGEFERYGSGNITVQNNNEITFIFVDERDAIDCQHELDKILKYLKRRCC